MFFMLSCLLCCLVVTCWERADLLALVGDVYCIFFYFPMWYPGSGVILDLSLPDLAVFFTLFRNLKTANRSRTGCI